MKALFVIALAVAVGHTEQSLATDTSVRTDFSSSRISRVVLRASTASEAKISIAPTGSTVISVSGVLRGGAAGYHAPTKGWQETPPAHAGLGFVAKVYGSTLVISTNNEIQFIHHHYYLDGIQIRVPSGVVVIREVRTLNGDGAPNLVSP